MNESGSHVLVELTNIGTQQFGGKLPPVADDYAEVSVGLIGEKNATVTSARALSVVLLDLAAQARNRCVT